MARVQIKSFVPQFKRSMNKEFVRRLHKVGEMVASQVRKNLSESTRANGPSVPGEFPHADTGFLRKSIVFEVDPAKLVVVIGTPVIYGKYLEEGTRRMDERPFLRRTVREMRNQIAHELAKPMAGGGSVGASIGIG